MRGQPTREDISAAYTYLRGLKRGDSVTVQLDSKRHVMTVSRELEASDFAYVGGRLERAGSMEWSGVTVTFGPGKYSTRISVTAQATSNAALGFIVKGESNGK